MSEASMPHGRLSLPVKIRQIDPPLTNEERQNLHDVADALIWPTDIDPRPSTLDGFDQWLDRAVAARGEDANRLRELLASLREVSTDLLWDRLRALDANDPDGFQLLSTVVAGAYLMHPVVREIIGYPGQTYNPPSLEEAADQLADGIMDPVVERGPIFVDIPVRKS